MRVGARARHAGIRDRPRSPVDDRLRGRRRGDRHLEEPRDRGRSASCAAGRPTTTGGRTPPDRRAPPRRSSSTADRATAPTAVPRSTRIASARSGTTCSCSTRWTARASCSVTSPTRTSTRAPRSSVSRWCCRTRRASSRPICSPRCSRRCNPCRASTTAPTRSTTSRSGSSASTRGPRRFWWPMGSSRRTRVAGTSFGGCCDAWSPHRASWAPSARCSARSWLGSSTGSATPIRSSGRTGRSSRRCSPPRRTASRRPCARAWSCSTRRATTPTREPSREPTRSSCPTRSGSRSS